MIIPAPEPKPTEHLLSSTWVLWEERSYADKREGEKWRDMLIPLAEFRTVEQFWKVWTHLPKLR